MATHARPSAVTGSASKRLSDARGRILAVADTVFYTNGIQQTSIEEISSLARVSRRVFAKNFPSKEQLVVSYIADRHDRDARLLTAIADSYLSHHLVFNMVLSEITTDLNTPGFRGCAFINAAAECPEMATVQAAVRSHREWYVATATAMLGRAGHGHPADAADRLLSARDEAMDSRYGDDAASATAALRRAMERVLAEIPEHDGDVLG